MKNQILAVDDNPSNLESLLNLLGDLYDLRVALDGRSALALIEEGFIPDLLLLDIMMPGMNGYELCREMKKLAELNGVPFIFLSALDSEEDESQGLQLGAADYISKPFQPPILMQRIKLHLELKTYRDKLNVLVAEKTQKLKQAEQKALQQEALYRELFNNMGNAVAVFDIQEDGRNFRIKNLNRAGQSTFRVSLVDIVGRNLSDLIPGSHQADLSAALRRVWTSGVPEHLPPTFYQGNNLSLWIDSYIYKLPSGEIVGIFDDVSEQKRSQAQILQAKEEWEKTFDAMTDCVTILDRDFRIIRANKATRQLFSLPYEDFIGKKCHNFFADQSHLCKDCPALTALERPAANSCIKTHDHLGKTFDISCSLIDGGPGSEPLLIHVARDVTEHLQLQEELNRASRLASIGELASGIAHEINNPNGLILHNSQLVNDVWNDMQPLLEKHLPNDENLLIGGLSTADIIDSLPQMLKDIHGASRRIKHIVTELRDFSSYDNDDTLEFVDLNEVATSSAYLVKNTIKKATGNFSVELEENLPVVRGVPTRLEQVIINLLINASQALENPAQEIWLKTEKDFKRKLVRILVGDTGSGIPEEIRDHLCEPFFTTKRQKGGTGLGLSVSNRIVKAHNGRLYFESTPNKGTTVTVEIPFGEQIDATD